MLRGLSGRGGVEGEESEDLCDCNFGIMNVEDLVVESETLWSPSLDRVKSSEYEYGELQAPAEFPHNSFNGAARRSGIYLGKQYRV